MALKYYRKQAGWNYWSLSPFAKKIRKWAGLDNPACLTSEGWKEHEQKSKQIAPFIYWLTEDGFDKVQDVCYFIPNLFYSVNVFYSNWKNKSHTLHSNLPVGEWCDLSDRIPICLFTSFEHFIEKEKGLDSLQWDIDNMKEEYPPQYEAAIEQKAIYDWWKKNKDRDFFVESGLAEFYSTRESNDIQDLMAITNQSGYRELSDLHESMEDQYRKEEEEMLIRLIKIRNSLWT